MSHIYKQTIPKIIIISNTYFYKYTSHNHYNILYKHNINNNTTLKNLNKQTIITTTTNTNFITPSTTINNQIQTIHQTLNTTNFKNTTIISYSTKFTSSFYNPFHKTTKNTLKDNHKNYQINPINHHKTIHKSLLNKTQNTNYLIIKPTKTYLNIIHKLRKHTKLPINTYQINNKYTIIKFTTLTNTINKKKIILKNLNSIKHTNTNLIFNYFTINLTKKKILH